MKPLSEWNVVDLRQALNVSGYTGDDILSCDFNYVNDRHEAIFTITYEDVETGELDDGKVFVFLNNKGVLAAEF